MGLPFDTCWRRVARAKLHTKTMTEFWNGFDTRDAYTHRVQIDDNGAGRIFLAPVKADWLSDFPLQFGEVLYQLRAALDSCVYDCAILQSGKNPPPNERDLQFPICATRTNFNNCRGQIAPLSNQVKTFIESIQPYQTAPLKAAQMGRILSRINDWARIDRHRTLPIIGTLPSDVDAGLFFPSDMVLEWSNVENGRILEHESQFATFKISGYRPDAQIDLNLAVALEVAIDDPGGIEVITKAPSSMIATVEEVIREFERLLGIKR